MNTTNHYNLLIEKRDKARVKLDISKERVRVIFETSYTNPEAAFDNFKADAKKKGTRKATDEINRQPWRYGSPSGGIFSADGWRVGAEQRRANAEEAKRDVGEAYDHYRACWKQYQACQDAVENYERTFPTSDSRAGADDRPAHTRPLFPTSQERLEPQQGSPKQGSPSSFSAGHDRDEYPDNLKYIWAKDRGSLPDPYSTGTPLNQRLSEIAADRKYWEKRFGNDTRHLESPETYNNLKDLDLTAKQELLDDYAMYEKTQRGELPEREYDRKRAIDEMLEEYEREEPKRDERPS